MTVAFTTIVAVDPEHALELWHVWPTWRKYKPELLANPMVIVCDTVTQPAMRLWYDMLDFVDHPNLSLWSWPMDPQLPQRERMLSALVYTMGDPSITTPWVLKLDTDAVATKPGPWIDYRWFARNPAYIASPWGYTKPADALDRLDAWGDTVPELAKHARLNIPHAPGASLVRSNRIISWLYFGRTDWHRWLSSLVPDRLPVPSQDTLCYYVAARTGARTERVQMSRFGWVHVHPSRLPEVARAVA